MCAVRPYITTSISETQGRLSYLTRSESIWSIKGYDVQYVSNFTDVDDKLIKAANELGEEVPVIAERFIKAYFEDVGALGCAKADCHPRVTKTWMTSSSLFRR